MRARLVAVALAAVAAVLPVQTTAADLLTPTKVLVVGDSISQGAGGDWTWRNWLWREVNRQHAQVDFVGPYTGVFTDYGTRYERSWPWDSAHDALWGSTIDYHQTAVVPVLAQYLPDVVVVQLGINDLLRGDPAPKIARQLEQLLEIIWAVRPTARVVLAELPNAGHAARDAAGAEVNRTLAEWAQGRPVVIAHNRTGGSGYPAWDPARFTLDGLHPNATGQTLYANAFAQALHTLGVLPAPPARVYQEREWSPDLRPSVKAAPGGVVVSWRTATEEVYTQYVRVLVDGHRATGWIRTPKRADDQSVRLSLPAGTHSVRLEGKRGSMVANPGSPVTVEVR